MIFQYNGKYHDLHEGKNSPELQAELEAQGLITFTDGEEVITNADGYIELAADRTPGERIVNKFLGVCVLIFLAAMLLAPIIGNDSDVDKVWQSVGLQ